MGPTKSSDTGVSQNGRKKKKGKKKKKKRREGEKEWRKGRKIVHERGWDGERAERWEEEKKKKKKT